MECRFFSVEKLKVIFEFGCSNILISGFEDGANHLGKLLAWLVTGFRKWSH